MNKRIWVFTIPAFMVLIYFCFCLSLAVSASKILDHVLRADHYDSYLSAYVSKEVFDYWFEERGRKTSTYEDTVVEVIPYFALTDFFEGKVWLRYTYYLKSEDGKAGFGTRKMPVILYMKRNGLRWYIDAKDENAY